jgi:uncharacterized protein YndB with AHSA1/START domain/DNA-binding transcriptional ArsR family regulator
MDKVFTALADKSRRYLLDLLYENNGQCLSDLCSELKMSRQAVSKHLSILENADLVIPVWKGREKLHYINPVPLRFIYLRWINKFEETRLQGLVDLKGKLENDTKEFDMKGFMYQIVISSSAEKVWKALIEPEFTKKFWFGRSVNSDWKIGSSVTIITPEGKEEMRGKVLEFQPNKRLSYTWQAVTENTEEKVTTVVFELLEMGLLTKLSILHDIDAEDAKFQQAASGWTFILCGIKTLLETGKPLPAIPWKHQS